MYHNFKELYYYEKNSCNISFAFIIASTALAANSFIERFYAFSNRDTGTIEEVNYYLEKGGIVKDFKCLRRGDDGTFTTMVIQIPTEVFNNQRYTK